MIKCAAQNELGTNVSSSLVLFHGNEETFFVEYNVSTTIYVGDNITITCVAINPIFNTVLEWFLDDERIGEFPEVIKNTSEGPEHRLQLAWPSIQLSDGGKYQCRKLFIDYGYSISTDFFLSVTGLLTIFHI